MSKEVELVSILRDIDETLEKYGEEFRDWVRNWVSTFDAIISLLAGSYTWFNVKVQVWDSGKIQVEKIVLPTGESIPLKSPGEVIDVKELNRDLLINAVRDGIGDLLIQFLKELKIHEEKLHDVVAHSYGKIEDVVGPRIEKVDEEVP